jgi:alpha-tubulin suppressor-like RCC1 family protein
MLRRPLPVLALVSATLLAACNETPSRTPLPTAPPLPGRAPAGSAALEAQINSLINDLYAPTQRAAPHQAIAQIKSELVSGRTTAAQADIVRFVGDALGAFKAGTLQDPNGAQPPTTADALRDLLNAVTQFAGMPALFPSTGSNPLGGGSGAVAIVGPAGGTVVAAEGFGGVQFPPGALPANVVVVISRLSNPTVPMQGPLPTTLDQYPLFYDFSTSPPVPQFAVPVVAAICRLEEGQPFAPATEDIADRLRLAHPDPANPTTVQILERVEAPFLSCAGVSLSQVNVPRQSGNFFDNVLERSVAALRLAGTHTLGMVLPTPAYAVHGGLGGKTISFSPFGAVDPGARFSGIGAGNGFACVLTSTGSVYCWGRNDQSQLGAATATTCGAIACSTTPVQVSGGIIFQTIDVGYNFSCGITGTNAACWGDGRFGELGNGSQSSTATPVTVAFSPFASVTAGQTGACGLTPGGAAYCWGSNRFNELGAQSSDTCLNQSRCSTTPVAVSGGFAFASLSAGVAENCGIARTGVAMCWGGIGSGSLGNGTNDALVAVPTPVSGSTLFQRIATQSITPCALTNGGEAYCWGNNDEGLVGDGTTTNRLVPTPVGGGHQFASLASTDGEFSGEHMCAITLSGDAYCWGQNANGELGAVTSTCTADPTLPCSTVPVLVSGGHKWRSLAVGERFTCGITTDDAVYCWGQNSTGELGNGSGTDSTEPVLIVGSFGGP